MSYTVLPPGDPSIETFRSTFLKIRRALGTNAFGVNEIRLPPGAEGREHDESDTGHEEVYMGLERGGTFTIDGTQVQLEPGGFLRIDPGTMRQVVAGRDGFRFLAIGAKPQPAYDGRESL